MKKRISIFSAAALCLVALIALGVVFVAGRDRLEPLDTVETSAEQRAITTTTAVLEASNTVATQQAESLQLVEAEDQSNADDHVSQGQSLVAAETPGDTGPAAAEAPTNTEPATGDNAGETESRAPENSDEQGSDEQGSDEQGSDKQANVAEEGAVEAAPPRGAAFETLRNKNPLFTKNENVTAAQVSLDQGLVSTDMPDSGDDVGNSAAFRVFCAYSHFSYDDPIIFPGAPGKAHLHMFFGNTKTNASSTQQSLLNSGGGTCQGGVLNRSAYWTPALLDGGGNIVVPDHIIIYYKTLRSQDVQPLPQGLQIVAGNTTTNGFSLTEEAYANKKLFWSCGSSGKDYAHTNQIPDCNGDIINATIAFPECWNGQLTFNKSNFRYAEGDQPCPASHPTMLPRISILLYYPGAESVDGWHLSSDGESYRGGQYVPGGSLHADWFGAWSDEAMDLLTNGCLQAGRNCTVGQTGTDRKFATIGQSEEYTGPNRLAVPPGSYTPHPR